MRGGRHRRTVEVLEEGPDSESEIESGLESGDQSEQRTLAEVEVEEQQERLRAELGDNEGYVVLMRRTSAGKLATLAKIPADVFSTEYVMQRYGGGFYVAKFFQYGLKVSEGGYKGSTRFEIDPSVLSTVLPPQQPATGSGGAEGQQPAGGWKDAQTLHSCYQLATPDGMLEVMSTPVKLRDRKVSSK